MKRRRFIAVLFLLVLCGALVLPPVRIRVAGVVRGESFFEGLPASYWREQALGIIRARFPSFRKYGLGSHSLPWLDSFLSFFPSRSDEEQPDYRLLAGDCMALGVLRELLGDRDGAVRQVACEGLAKIGPAAASAIPLLVALLGDPELDGWMDMEDKSETSAQKALEKIGAASVPALLHQLQEHGAETEKIIVTLGGIGPAASPAIPALKANLKKYPLAAACSLGQIGPKAFPVLLEAMKSADRKVSLAATSSIYLVGPQSVPVLLQAAKSPDREIRLAVSGTLCDSGGDPKILLPVYIRLLKDGDAEVRHNAAYSLGEMKEEGIPGLIEALKSPDPEVVKEAISGLNFTPNCTAIMTRMLQEERDPRIREDIERALKRFGGPKK